MVKTPFMNVGILSMVSEMHQWPPNDFDTSSVRQYIVAIVSVYASTTTNPDEAKDNFYTYLENVMSESQFEDKFIVLGDFNASVGRNYQTWE